MNHSLVCFYTAETPQYRLSYTTASATDSQLYDIVVLATPLQESVGSEIRFQDFNPPFDQLSGTYHSTVATIVHGYLNTSLFGFPDPRLFPFASILTMEAPNLFFNSVASVCPVNISAAFRRKQPQEAGVYKVFSQQPLDKTELKMLFRSAEYDILLACNDGGKKGFLKKQKRKFTLAILFLLISLKLKGKYWILGSIYCPWLCACERDYSKSERISL